MVETLRAAGHALGRADLAWLATAFALYFMSVAASAARWRLVVRAVGGRVGLVSAFLATVGGLFVNNVTPTSRLGGEACRIALTRARGELSLARGALAILCDRLTDAPPVAVLFLVALPVLGPVVAGRVRLGAAIVLVAAVLAVLFTRWVRRSSRAWLSSWRRELGDVRLAPHVVAGAMGWSALVWFEDVLRLLAVAAGFGIALTVPQVAALCVIAMAGGLVPTIGGLGAVEGGLVAGLVLYDVPLDVAIAMTAVERTISYGVSTVTGGVIVASLGGWRLLSGGEPRRQRDG